MFLFIHILAVDFHGNRYKYFTPKKTLAHTSVLFMNRVTKGADALSCKFYQHLHLHTQHIKHELCQQSLVLEEGQHCPITLSSRTSCENFKYSRAHCITPSPFPDTGQATVESSQSDHLTELYLTSFLTVVKQQAALDIRQCSARVQSTEFVSSHVMFSNTTNRYLPSKSSGLVRSMTL